MRAAACALAALLTLACLTAENEDGAALQDGVSAFGWRIEGPRRVFSRTGEEANAPDPFARAIAASVCNARDVPSARTR